MSLSRNHLVVYLTFSFNKRPKVSAANSITWQKSQETEENGRQLRSAKVRPIHEKKNRPNVENFIPVLLLNFESKILDKSVFTALYEHFSSFPQACYYSFDKT